MNMVTMKCPECGDKISLDPTREFGFCSSCGSKIQLDDSNIFDKNRHYTKDDVDALKEMNRYKEVLLNEANYERTKKEDRNGLILFFVLLIVDIIIFYIFIGK